jgi:hypothetical protein
MESICVNTVASQPAQGLCSALPEPPAARWRRRWVARLEAVLHKIAVAGSWVHVIWIQPHRPGAHARLRQQCRPPASNLGLLAVVLLVDASRLASHVDGG